VEDSFGIRHYLLCLGIDFSGDARRRPRGAAIPVGRHSLFRSGIVLYGWMRLKGAPSPSRREWAGATLLGALIFLVNYGCPEEDSGT
jgi:hypothetical protein